MSGGGSALDVAIDNLSSPWDLAAIFLGVAAAGATAIWGGWTFDSLLPVGAFGSLALRKGLQALSLKSRLRRRASAIKEVLADFDFPDQLKENLKKTVSMEGRMWQRGASSNDDFAQILADIVATLREDRKKLHLECVEAAKVEIDDLKRQIEKLKEERKTFNDIPPHLKEPLPLPEPLVDNRKR